MTQNSYFLFGITRNLKPSLTQILEKMEKYALLLAMEE